MLCVEGETEIEFYKAIINNAHQKMGKPFPCSFKYEDMRGIGNYKTKALRRFCHIQKENPDSEIYVYLCIDTDVFEFTKRPPIDKAAVKDALEEAGAKKVTYIEAKHSIEDWFLFDLEGVVGFLRLPLATRKPSGSGQEAIKKLFKQANKVYVKGTKIEGFVSSLDIPRIMKGYCTSLKPLCRSASLECSKVCGVPVKTKKAKRKKT